MKQKLLKILYSFLALCARIHLTRHNIQVIAITGSVGKTSCRMVVAEVLKQLDSEKSIYTSPKNYNSELGLVFSVFQIEDYHPSTKTLLKLSGKIFWKAIFGRKTMDILVAEYGIDSPHDMEHLLKIAIPDIAVLTKLDSVHSANFPNGVEEYWQEKWKLLIAARKKVYLNLQDNFSQQHISLLKNYAEMFAQKSLFTELQRDKYDIARWHFAYKGKNISHNLLGGENNHYVTLGLDIA
jgi:UDP-N-acetylmuramyl pentapeptide synthase